MSEQVNALSQESVPIGKTTDEEVDRLLQHVTTDKLSPQELKSFKTVADVKDRRYKMEYILNIWKNTQDDERKLRRRVAYWILAALFMELAAGNTAFFFIGFSMLSIPEWVAQTFIIGMYTQIVSIVLIVVKSLFPAPKADALSELNQMVDKL